MNRLSYAILLAAGYAIGTIDDRHPFSLWSVLILVATAFAVAIIEDYDERHTDHHANRDT